MSDTEVPGGNVPAPWETDGLPDGIELNDLSQAESFFTTGVMTSPKRLIPAHQERIGFYYSLSGTQYVQNTARLADLLRCQSMCVDDRGSVYYPAILIPDPTKVWRGRDLAPIAVCCQTGYLGSAWQHEATLLRPDVDRAFLNGQLVISRVRLNRVPIAVSPTGWTPFVWLPTSEKYG